MAFPSTIKDYPHPQNVLNGQPPQKEIPYTFTTVFICKSRTPATSTHKTTDSCPQWTMVRSLPFFPLSYTLKHNVRSYETPLSLQLRIVPPPRIPISAQPIALPQVISPAVADPGSSAPADTAPGPAAAADPPTPTAAMLASARSVPSATAGYFRIHHVRFRASGVVGGALAGTGRWVFLARSKPDFFSNPDSKMVVSSFPNFTKT